MTDYPMFKVHIDVKAALGELRIVLESGFVNEGQQVVEFQEVLANFLGVEHLVLTNSCTSALTIALRLCGVVPGADVVTTPMTCVATNTPIDNLGGLRSCERNGRFYFAHCSSPSAFLPPPNSAIA